MSQRYGSELSPTQLVAGGLATATATVAASYLGVAGTILGAAFMSVVTTAGAAIYKHYLDRGKSRYVTLVGTEIRHHVARPDAEPAGPTQGEPAAAEQPRTEVTWTPSRPDQPLDQPPDVPSEMPSDVPSEMASESPSAPAARRRPRWYVLAGAAVAIFAVVMGGVTLVESLTNKPLSAMVGKSDRSGTTLGRAVGTGGSAPGHRPSIVPSSTLPTAPPSTPSAVPSTPTTTPPVQPPPSTQPTGTPSTQPPTTPSFPTTPPTVP